MLDYLVGQDDECRLLTVGSWYAMTGYGVAFPRNSKHFHNFNKKIMDYSENGKPSLTKVNVTKKILFHFILHIKGMKIDYQPKKSA